MKFPALAFALLFVTQLSFAADEEGIAFIQTKSEATTLARSDDWVESKTDIQNEVGNPRHYVTSYQLIIEELFGFHFQCVSSSTWSKEFDPGAHSLACKIYLNTSCMTYADPEKRYSPYAVATWSGLLLVNRPSALRLDYIFNYHHGLSYGTQAVEEFSVTYTRLGHGVIHESQKRMTEFDNVGVSYTVGMDFYEPGVYKIEVSVRSFFSTPYYHLFNNLQAGAYIEIIGAEGYFCNELAPWHIQCD